MPNGTVSAPVTFDYNNGSPNWTVQSPITVDHGDVDTIQWTLSATNLPSGTTARFATTTPIQFVTVKGGNRGDTWMGQPPQRVSDTLVQVDDDNSGPPVYGTKSYYYSITVQTVDGNGNVRSWTDDPEVENPGT